MADITDDDVFALLATVNMAFLHVVSPKGRDRIQQAVGGLLKIQLATPPDRAFGAPTVGKRKRGRPRKPRNNGEVAARPIAAQ